MKDISGTTELSAPIARRLVVNRERHSRMQKGVFTVLLMHRFGKGRGGEDNFGRLPKDVVMFLIQKYLWKSCDWGNVDTRFTKTEKELYKLSSQERTKRQRLNSNKYKVDTTLPYYITKYQRKISNVETQIRVLKERKRKYERYIAERQAKIAKSKRICEELEKELPVINAQYASKKHEYEVSTQAQKIAQKMSDEELAKCINYLNNISSNKIIE